MKAKKLRRRALRRRGQVMVLGALGVLLVALMMLLTLNVGKAIFEKVRIQQLADASAFSDATLAARSFNYYAYTNRANIAGLVAAASAHGIASLASTVPGMFHTAGMNYLVMAGMEFVLCCLCQPFCCAVHHCIHGIRDIFVWLDYEDKADDLEDDLTDASADFIRAIKALDFHISAIAAQQQLMRGWTMYMLGADRPTQELLDKYSPGSERFMAIGGLNALNYDNAIEPYDDDGKTKRKFLGTVIANGTRYNKFVTYRDLGAVLLGVFPTTLMDLIFEIPDSVNGFSFPIWHEGESRIVEDGTDVRNKIENDEANGVPGTAAAAADEGWIFSLLANNCIPMMTSKYAAQVGSNTDSGEHKCTYFFGIDYTCCDDEGAHKDAFKCLGKDSEVTHNCFMLFRSNDQPQEDFGQPVFYAAIKSDLRRTRGEGRKQVWEVTDDESGKIKVNFGQIHNKVQSEMGGSGGKEIQISDNPEEFGEGLAISKAMAYYHHPKWDDNNQSGWKEPPNFFNPYWKAKLQPFRDTGEFRNALMATAGTGAKYLPLVFGGILTQPPLP